MQSLNYSDIKARVEQILQQKQRKAGFSADKITVQAEIEEILNDQKIKDLLVTTSQQIKEAIKDSKSVEINDDSSKVIPKSRNSKPKDRVKKIPCHNYYVGSCTNKNCRYSHLGQGNIGTCPIDNCKICAKTPQPQLCHYYYLKGCKNDNCKNGHVGKGKIGKCPILNCKICEKIPAQNIQKLRCHDYYLKGCSHKNCQFIHEGKGELGYCPIMDCQMCSNNFKIDLNFSDSNKLMINEICQNLYQDFIAFKRVENYEKCNQILKEFQLFQAEMNFISKCPNKDVENFLCQNEIKKKQQSLPAYFKRNDIIKEIFNINSTFSMIVGHTGSGKSTQVPQYILINQIKYGQSGNIYCIQPRKIAAKSLAYRVAEELGGLGEKQGKVLKVENIPQEIEFEEICQLCETQDVKLDSNRIALVEYSSQKKAQGMLEKLKKSLPPGTHVSLHIGIGDMLVGYDFGKHDRSSCIEEKSAVLIFTSEGFFLNKLIGWKNRGKLQNCKIFLDEVHERSFQNDIILGTLKNLDRQKKLPKSLKVILCSATVNEEQFQRFFPEMKIVEIEGKTFPIRDEFGIDVSQDQAMRAITSKVRDILNLKRNKSNLPIHGHILIFVDTVPNINLVIEDIEALLEDIDGVDPTEYIVLPLHGLLEQDDQRSVFNDHFNSDKKQFKTKIIVSTSIAESSVTIDGVTVVIDSGLSKKAEYDPIKKLTLLKSDYISQSQAIQRRGRAGRTSEGICYRMFSQDQFEEFQQDKAPEIKMTNPEMVILKMLSIGIPLKEFDLIEPLDQKMIDLGIQQLQMIGALSQSQELTLKGRTMIELPTEPIISNVILQGYNRGCHLEVLQAFSVSTNVQNLFIYNKTDKKEETKLDQLKQKCNNQEILFYHTILDEFIKYTKEERKQHNFNFKQLRKKEREFCSLYQLKYRTLLQCFSDYETLKREVSQKMKYAKEELQPLFKKDEQLSKENLEIRLTKCFFSSFFQNFSIKKNKSYLMKCGDLTFQSDYNSCITKKLKQKETIKYCFWLNIIQNEEKVRAIGVQEINDELNECKDLSVVSPNTLSKIRDERFQAMDEHLPFYLELHQSDHFQFKNKFKRKIQYLQDELRFEISFSENQIEVVANKILDNGQKNDTEVIKREICELISKYNEEKENYTVVKKLDNSNVRIAFGARFNPLELLGPQDFLSVSLNIEAKKLNSIFVNENEIKQMSQYGTGKYLKIKYLFYRKFQALKFYQENQKLFKLQKESLEQERSKHQILVRFNWIIAKSRGVAIIHFENEIDPEKAMEKLQGKFLGNLELNDKQVGEREANLVNEGKDQKLEDIWNVKLKFLPENIDESDIMNILDPGDYMSQPNIILVRDIPKTDQETIKNQCLQEFKDFLNKNNLSHFMSQTTIEIKKFYAQSSIQVDSQEQAEELTNRFNERIGVLGHQKLRVKSKFQNSFKVRTDVFKILFLNYTKVKDELVLNNLGAGLHIFQKEYGEFTTIIWQSESGKVYLKAQNSLKKLFNNGTQLFGVGKIQKFKKNEFQQLITEFDGKITIQNNNGIKTMFAESDKVLQAFLEKLEQLKNSLKQKGKAQNDEELCEICYCDNENLFTLDCGHKLHQECLQEYLFSTLENKLTKGICCPIDKTCAEKFGNITTKELERACEDRFEEICQRAILELITKSDQIVACWTPDCPAYSFFDGNQSEFQCQICAEKWCLKKLKEVKSGEIETHEPHDDETPCRIAAKQKKSDSQFNDMILPKGKIITSQWIKDQKAKNEIILRRCPNSSCQNIVEHIEACFHMTCKCNTHWCFLCGEEFSKYTVYKHMTDAHGGYY